MTYKMTSDEYAAARTTPQGVRRYLSVDPRDPIVNTTVASYATDPISNGVISITVNGSPGILNDVVEDMTVQVYRGSLVIGKVRTRKASTVGSLVLHIGETAFNLIAMVAGDTIKVFKEFSPYRKLPRIVEVVDQAPYADIFTEYRDYDVAYTNQNVVIPPKANITQNGSVPAKPAGWVDSGQIYRTVRLDASTSEIMQTGASSLTYSWDVEDGSIVDNGPGNIWIEVEFPDALVYRLIKLTVTDNLGASGYRWFPIWVHNAENPPITRFKVTEDQRAEGRQMSFDFNGVDTDISPDVFPIESLVCYWEEPYFGGEDVPSYYIDQYLGWVMSGSAIYKSTQTSFTVKTGGVQAFLEGFEGFAQDYENATSPSKWYQMNNIRFDKLVYLTLRWFTTVISISNLYKSDLDYPIQDETISKGNIWQQITGYAESHSVKAAYDSTNSLFLVPDMDYLESADRLARITVDHIQAGDWTWDSPIVLSLDLMEKVGNVHGTGSTFNGTDSDLYAANAPGKTPGQSGAREELPFQRLPLTNPLLKLRQLVGHHMGKLNDPYQAFPVNLILNLDYIEPAWNQPIELTYAADHIRGSSVNFTQLLFMPQSVSVTHSNEPGQKPKSIVVNVKRVTDGRGGDEEEQPTDDTTPGNNLFPGTELVAPNPGVWCKTFDFTQSDGGFVLSPSSGAGGLWVAGVGWTTTVVDSGGTRFHNALIRKSFASSTITSVEMIYDLTKGTYTSPVHPARQITCGGTQQTANPSVSSGTNQSYIRSGSFGAQTLAEIRIDPSIDNSAPFTSSGSGVITSCTICGLGANPFL